MKPAKPILAVIAVLLLFTAACGGSDEDAEPSIASGLEDREWRGEYEDAVRTAFEDAERPTQRNNCRQARRSTKDEMIELFLGVPRGGTNFEKTMERLDVTPSDEDFTYAAGLAVDVIRDLCATEFPALAEPLPADGDETETVPADELVPDEPDDSSSTDG